MAGSKGPAYGELFLRGRAGGGDPAALEASLQQIVDRAVRAWPDLPIDPARLVAHLAVVVGEGQLEDVALGLACAEKLPGALTHVDRTCGGAIDAAVARIDRSPELRDEVRQTLWQ